MCPGRQMLKWVKLLGEYRVVLIESLHLIDGRIQNPTDTKKVHPPQQSSLHLELWH